MNDKLHIVYVKDGYTILLPDGTPMEFTDGSKTSGFKKIGEAISVCVEHGYKFEII